MTLEQFKRKQAEAEKAFVRSVLTAHGWACVETSKALGIAPTTLLTTLKRLGLTQEYQTRKPARGKR